MERLEQQTMSLQSAIVGRRTIRNFNGKPLPQNAIAELLEDAVWAPFHSPKEPWRFILFTGDGRNKFADAVRLTQSKEMLEKWDNWIETQYCSLMQAHLIVVVKTFPKHQEWEEALMAASALIQNIQLLAWERDIGVVWKTHDYNWDERFHRAVGVRSDERIAGTLHLGYFDSVPKAKRRTSAAKLLTCFGNESDPSPASP